MAKKTVIILVFILLIGAGLCVFVYWTNSQSNMDTTISSQPIKGIAPEEISTLQNGVLVRFPATIVTHLGNNCVEIFTEENFKKYGGDPKWGSPATFRNGPSVADRFRSALYKSNHVIITGRMTFVRDNSNGPCDVVTGQLFEITQIEYR